MRVEAMGLNNTIPSEVIMYMARETCREMLDYAQKGVKLARIAYGRAWMLHHSGSGGMMFLFLPNIKGRKKACVYLQEAGINTPEKLLALEIQDVLKIPGIGKNFIRDLEDKHGRLW